MINVKRMTSSDEKMASCDEDKKEDRLGEFSLDVHKSKTLESTKTNQLLSSTEKKRRSQSVLFGNALIGQI